MKKLLLTLTLFAVIPLCAMKRKESNIEEAQKPHESRYSLMLTWIQKMQQNFLDKRLYAELDQLFFKPDYECDITPLLKLGANPNANSPHQPCLFLAVRPATIHALFKYGAHILQCNHTQSTVFHTIASSGSAELLARFLLYAQAQKLDLDEILSMENEHNHTPKSLAQGRGSPFFSMEGFDFGIDDKKKMLRIMANPYRAIFDLYPEVFEDFQRAQLALRVEKSGARSAEQYIQNREMGRTQ